MTESSILRTYTDGRCDHCKAGLNDAHARSCPYYAAMLQIVAPDGSWSVKVHADGEVEAVGERALEQGARQFYEAIGELSSAAYKQAQADLRAS